MKKLIAAGALVGALLVAQTGAAMADKSTAPGQLKKLGVLEVVAGKAQGAKMKKKGMASLGKAGPNNEISVADVSDDGYVLLEAVATGDAANLEQTMKSMGAKDVASYGRIVSARFPVDRLADLSNSGYLAFARPSFKETNVGLVDSQGDRSMNTDDVRNNLGFDASGLTIGVLSDSFACATTNDTGNGPFTTTADDIASGDLPSGITILADLTPAAPPPNEGCIDEGRAMAQLIFDSIPGAKIAFHTAFNGQADFAQGIIELAKAGADVIVDDVIYFTEPMFQDGIIAQAADEVNRLGVPYYSSNGNRARDAFEADYRPVNATIDATTGIWHDFDDGPGVDLLHTVALNGALQTNLTFQWDSPNFSVSGAPGAQNDVDVVMFDSAGVRVADCFPGGGPFVFPANGLCQFQFTSGGVPIDGGAGGDAIELVSLVDFTGGATIQLGLLTESGTAPGFVKYVLFGGGFAASEYAVDAPSGFGHNNAAGAEGVGAAWFGFTEEFENDPQTFDIRANAGEPWCIPACLNDFSSAGGTPIFFDTAGNRHATPEVRLKPGITAPDGTNNTFFRVDTFRDDDDGDGTFASFEPGEFPNFFGTSAAAPHAATIAAMMIDAEDSEILEVKKNGKVKYNLCKLHPNKPGRANGTDVTVAPPALNAQLNNGAVLGPCSRTEPSEIRNVMRSTAQDMSIRAGLSSGATIQIFDEVGPDGFDFDSGFGFVDAEAALDEFLNN